MDNFLHFTLILLVVFKTERFSGVMSGLEVQFVRGGSEGVSDHISLRFDSERADVLLAFLNLLDFLLQ
jgi:hypothetical protein